MKFCQNLDLFQGEPKVQQELGKWRSRGGWGGLQWLLFGLRQWKWLQVSFSFSYFSVICLCLWGFCVSLLIVTEASSDSSSDSDNENGYRFKFVFACLPPTWKIEFTHFFSGPWMLLMEGGTWKSPATLTPPPPIWGEFWNSMRGCWEILIYCVLQELSQIVFLCLYESHPLLVDCYLIFYATQRYVVRAFFMQWSNYRQSWF